MASIEDLLRITDAVSVEADQTDAELALRALLRAYLIRVQGERTDGDFARAMGVSRTTVQALKNGPGQVTVEQIAMLAKIQGKSALAVLIDLAALGINQPSSMVPRADGKAPAMGVPDGAGLPPGVAVPGTAESRVSVKLAAKMRKQKKRRPGAG